MNEFEIKKEESGFIVEVPTLMKSRYTEEQVKQSIVALEKQNEDLRNQITENESKIAMFQSYKEGVETERAKESVLEPENIGVRK